ncbi:MAG: type II secretion system F family protein [Phycisphaerales bacterium]|nr:type II secretion system F family protein [Phycisphaerales bacterium]
MNMRYKGFDKDGKPVQGLIEANGPGEAREKLSRQGMFVLEINETGRDAAAEVNQSVRTAPWTAHKRLGHLAEFSRQLSVLVSTGTPLVQALAAVERQASDPAWSGTVRDLRERVEQGTSLAEAMADSPGEFDAVTRSLIAAGENAGNLQEMLRRLSGITRQRQKTVSTIMGAMLYPALLICVSVVVIIVMLVFVVPRFAGMFESLDTPLPATTKILLDAGELLRGWWFVIAPTVLLIPVGAFFLLATPKGRRFTDSASLKIPVLGRVVQGLLLARIARMLGVLLASHVKLLEALELTRQAAGNVHYREMLVRATERVTTGDNLASVLAKSRLVTPAFAETVRNGEESGQLGAALSSLAEFMDEDNEIAVKSLTSLIEPAILIVLGFVVGFVAISLFLPLFDLTASAGGPR